MNQIVAHKFNNVNPGVVSSFETTFNDDPFGNTPTTPALIAPAAELIVVSTDLLDIDRVIKAMEAEGYKYYLDTKGNGFHAVFQTRMSSPIGYIYATGDAPTSREATIKAYIEAKKSQAIYAERAARRDAQVEFMPDPDVMQAR